MRNTSYDIDVSNGAPRKINSGSLIWSDSVVGYYDTDYELSYSYNGGVVYVSLQRKNNAGLCPATAQFNTNLPAGPTIHDIDYDFDGSTIVVTIEYR